MIASSARYRTIGKPRSGPATYNVKVRCYCCGDVVFTFTDVWMQDQLWSMGARVCERCRPSNKKYEALTDGNLVWHYVRHKRCKCGGAARPSPAEVAAMPPGA